MTREKIDKKALNSADALEHEFFRFIKETYEIGKTKKGVPIILEASHRELKENKTILEFNQRHALIWKQHEESLFEEGYLIK